MKAYPYSSPEYQSFRGFKLFIVILAVFVVLGDWLTNKFVFFRVLSYVAVVFLVCQLVNLRFNIVSMLAGFSILSSSILVGLFGVIEFDIFLKYLLLGIVLVLLQNKGNQQSFIRICDSLVFPLIFIIFIGMLQVIWAVSDPASYVTFTLGYIRPIGISVEPTFFSQQLVFLWIIVNERGLVKGRFWTALTLAFLFLIAVCATRSSLLILLVYATLSFRKNARFAIHLLWAIPILFYFADDELVDMFSRLATKVGSIVSVTGEPRETAFLEMQRLVAEVPVFGYGYKSITSLDGLEIGSLYAFEPMAMMFSMGVLSTPFLVIAILSMFRGWIIGNHGVVIGVAICSLAMPFLYTPFGMFVFAVSVVGSLRGVRSCTPHAQRSSEDRDIEVGWR